MGGYNMEVDYSILAQELDTTNHIPHILISLNWAKTKVSMFDKTIKYVRFVFVLKFTTDNLAQTELKYAHYTSETNNNVNLARLELYGNQMHERRG